VQARSAPSAVPVLLAGGDIHDVAGRGHFERAVPALDQTAAVDHQEQLRTAVRVPVNRAELYEERLNRYAPR
jgi:hypothetical protein